MASDAGLRVTVIYSPAPRTVHEISLVLPAGATARDAVLGSGLAQSCPDLNLLTATLGVWGRKGTPNQVLQDLDRVEIYRSLTVDPKIARRERFARQGARTAGLFQKKREGAKSGY
jgi:uncharacterized protein